MTNLIKLNLARNCLKYIIRAYGIKEIFIPYYICPVVWLAAREEKCKVKFYHIDKNFMPVQKFRHEDFILYVNYFGLCSKNCEYLSLNYKNLIIDNSQSFYTKPLGLASFNSLRKFFNVPNGAYLYCEKILQQKVEQDSTDYTPVLFHKNLEQFIKNELLLNKEITIKRISPYSEKVLNSIDFEDDKKQRLNLFEKYNEIFNKSNIIKIKPSPDDIPYCYPLSPDNESLKKILAGKFILLRLWQDIPQIFAEHRYLNNTIALPLNDRKYAYKILNYFN